MALWDDVGCLISSTFGVLQVLASWCRGDGGWSASPRFGRRAVGYCGQTIFFVQNTSVCEVGHFFVQRVEQFVPFLS